VSNRRGPVHEGLDVTIDAGGPSIDGVAMVASGQADIGQLSSSPSLMLAVSEGVPIKAFATGAQEHPYTFFSLPENPLNSPEDFAGLHVGTQATGEILLNAMLAANDMTRDDIADFTAVGADVTPLLSGQVDVWTGWLTNTAQLNQLPEGSHQLRLWDTVKRPGFMHWPGVHRVSRGRVAGISCCGGGREVSSPPWLGGDGGVVFVP